MLIRDNGTVFARRFSNLGFFLLFLSILLLSAGGHVVVGDEETMFRLTQNWLEGRGIAVSREELLIPAQNYPGFLPVQTEILPTTSAVPGRDGNTYSKYGIGVSLAAAPLYLLGRLLEMGQRCEIFSETTRLIVSMLNPIFLAACGGALACFAQALGYSLRTARFLALAGVFSTFSWPYVKTLYPQPGVALLLLGAVYFAFVWRREGRPASLWALGFCCAGMILFRPSEAFILPALALYLTLSVPPQRRWKWIAPLGGCAVLALGWTALYNWLRFGSFFSSGYSEATWTTPVGFGLYGLLVSPGKGVLFYAPLMVLSLASWRLFHRRNRPESWLFTGLWVSFLAFYAPYQYWTGGWNWGPRFLLPLMPLSVLPIGAWLDAAPRIDSKGALSDFHTAQGTLRSSGHRTRLSIHARLAWVLFVLFAILGFFLQLPAILVDHSRYLDQAVIGIDDPCAYTRTIIDPAYSPLWRQWPAVMEVFAIYRNPKGWQAAAHSLQRLEQVTQSQFVPGGASLLKAEFFRRNTFDFWWLHPRLSNPSYQVWPVILPWLLLGIAGAAVLIFSRS